MKVITGIISCVFFMFCCPMKSNETNSKINKNGIVEKQDFKNCPSDGHCTISIIKNKKIVIQKDEINGIYYTLEDNGTNSILKYTYLKQGHKDALDDNYTEEVSIPFEHTKTNLELKDAELKGKNILFGKHCYCKDEAGYYVIEKGKLFLSIKEDSYLLKFDFEVSNITQKISSIDATF